MSANVTLLPGRFKKKKRKKLLVSFIRKYFADTALFFFDELDGLVYVVVEQMSGVSVSSIFKFGDFALTFWHQNLSLTYLILANV